MKNVKLQFKMKKLCLSGDFTFFCSL